MNLNLSRHRALVGGSTQGIGKAVAHELALLGADVTLLARNETLLRQVCDQLPRVEGQQHGYIVADFAAPHAVRQALQDHLQHEGVNEWHILVNNTGGPPNGALHKADIAAIDEAINAHLKVNHLLVQALLPFMQRAGYGRVINIISTSVKEPIEGLGVSNTTRWAVAAWAKTLAGELATANITVNNVLPGYTRTARLNSLIENRAAQTGKDPAEIENAMIQTVPARRFGTAEEIAAAVAFLASPAAAYINGINLVVDGGRTRSL